MKHILSVIHPKGGFMWEPTRRNRFYLLASSTKGPARFAPSHAYANYRWQTHGEVNWLNELLYVTLRPAPERISTD